MILIQIEKVFIGVNMSGNKQAFYEGLEKAFGAVATEVEQFKTFFEGDLTKEEIAVEFDKLAAKISGIVPDEQSSEGEPPVAEETPTEEVPPVE